VDIEEAMVAGGGTGAAGSVGLRAWWVAGRLCELLVLSVSLKLCEPAHQWEQQRGRLDVHCGLRAGW